MNRNQFISFMDHADKLSSDDSVLIGNLLKDFPYFQTAHLLYAKSLHNEHSIHYNNQLKVSAAYATNRKVLHSLITKKSITPSTTVEEDIPENILEIKKEPTVKTIKNDSVPIEAIKNKEESIEELAANVDVERNKRILAERLSELNRVKEKQDAAIEQESKEIDEGVKKAEEIISSQNDNNTPQIIAESEIEGGLKLSPAENILSSEEEVELITGKSDDATEENKDVEELEDVLEKEYLSQAAIAKIELEVLSEDALLSSPNDVEENEKEEQTVNFVLDTPQPTVEVKRLSDASFDAAAPHSFIDWLKHSSETASKVETLVIQAPIEEQEQLPKKSSGELVETFLKQEPRMPKPKAAFYNPVNMAKQSVEDDITFVSETLAKIFMMQGNYTKALDAYESLRLKYPEKRLYFASQIKKLRKLINSQK